MGKFVPVYIYSYMVKRIRDPPVLIEQLNPCGNFIAVAGRWLGG